ncbi:MAG: hypothetical protein ACRD5D_02920 [Candidatus Polarisedimenticolia bacterium]
MPILTPQRRKEIVLGVILVLMAVALWHNLGTAPGTGGGSGAGAAGGRPADIGGLKVFPVEWASLTAPRPAYDPSGRNIFQFGATPPPPPPRLTPEEEALIRETQRKAEEERQRQLALQRQAAEEAARLVAQQNPLPPVDLTPPPPPKPQPPPIAYKFIGYIGPPERKIAVLHDGADLLFVRQGEEVGKGFKILEIGYESIKFGYTDPLFKGETTTLPMSSSY